VAIDLDRARRETPGCQAVLHLNNAGAALMPQPVLHAVVGHVQLNRDKLKCEALSYRQRSDPPMEEERPRSGHGTLLCPTHLLGASEPMATNDVIGINSSTLQPLPIDKGVRSAHIERFIPDRHTFSCISRGTHQRMPVP